jgi:pimeloyl-ACP methyl ester carboxylesterase
MEGKNKLGYETMAIGRAFMLTFALVLTALPVFAAPRNAPCTSATAACTQWLQLGHARAMVYSTFPLGEPDNGIRRALIMVHGALRNADHYFKTAMGAAFLAGALGDTIIIAPAFHAADGGDCKDKLEPHEVNWSCKGDSWRSGGDAASDPELSSFDFVDAILRKLADKRIFPNLAQIVIAGHSAGGQFVARYEMANRVHDTLGVAISYVVANPSSYAWPDAMRVLPVNDGAPGNATAGWKEETAHTDFRFGPFDATKAPNYDRWPFGLENRTGRYTANESDDQLRKQLATRPTTYLLSQVDTLPLGGFDDSPPAMAQGATRRARGEAFVKYINEKFGGQAQILIVPECGHNDRCVFTTDAVTAVMFPAP